MPRKKVKASSPKPPTEKARKSMENTTPLALPNEELPFKKGFFRDWFEVLMYGLALFMFLKGFVFQNFQIPTSSMENTLLIGDHITANKFIYGSTQWEWEKRIFPFRDITRGDVVVFKYPLDVRQDYIKRCIGLPGDVFSIAGSQVYLNGERLEMEDDYTYYKSKEFTGRDPDNKNYPLHFHTLKSGLAHAEDVLTNDYFGRDLTSMSVEDFRFMTLRTLAKVASPQHQTTQEWIAKLRQGASLAIPEDYYLVMGDNRNNSADSRFWGLVPRSLIEGRAYCIWWSYGEEEGTHQLKGMALIHSYVRVIWRFFSHTHWERTFHIIR